MAASSSSSASSVSPLPPSSPPPSHSSLYTGEWEYDVFLCFRGDDTRLGFTSHLMNALSDKQIRTFIDNMLEKTESIDELISILQRSALSVVIFSEKFADSVWCLDEVATIARRMVKFGHRVLPIFYNVDPSDVADDCRSYATTIDREYKGRITYSEDKKKWMNALKNVANCAGHTSQAIKIESELIKAIVEDVQKQLIDMSPCIKSADLVGMGSRILEWDGYPAKSLPSKFHAQHLVHLIIRQSPIRRCWKGYDQPQLVNLIVLDLSYCKNLIAIPNISRSSNLEELLLCACESLVEVPSNFQYLTKLITLDLTKCRNLKRLPPKLDSKLLKHVRMSHCPKVTHCPEISSRELEVFNLEETPLVELPNAIYNVKQDGVLYLYGKYITKFPAITASLKTFALCHTSIREIDLHDYHYHQASSELVLPRFHQLYLDGNSQLKSLPKSIWNMVSYSLVIYESPLIEILPEVSEPVNSFTSLYIGYCGGLKSLPSNLGNIKSLTFLSLSNVGVTSLPSSIQELKQLTIIELSCCKSLMSIPSSIHKLSKLLNLRLKDCKSIRSLPELPPNLESLDVSSCKSLQALPSNTGKLLHLESLKFDDCPQFNQTSLAEIVANFLPHASLVLDHKYTLVCSRIELPEWFTYKSVNLKKAERCIVKVALPLLKDSGQSIIKGIAFGAVVSPQPDYYPMRMTCECKVGNTTVASWNPQTRDQVVTCESFSEMLWLAFDNNLLGCNQWLSLREGKEDEAWHL
ncbi:Disease resistance protein RPV1 [Linum perenne]